MFLLIKQVRSGGTQVVLGKGDEPKRVYHFKPRDPKKPDENHRCKVTDQLDLATLLAIPEGYHLDPDQSDDAPAAVVGVKVPAKPAPSPTASTGTGEQGAAQAEDLETLDKAQLLERASAKAGKAIHPSTGKAKLIAIINGQA